MSKSDFDPSKIDPSRIQFASQDGVEQFESLARERTGNRADTAA